jgi:peptide/nickel transport system ATP-binding protein
VVRHIADEVMVMYLGQVVERGKTADIFSAPAHPYTRALLASMPSHDPINRTLQAPIIGDPPSPIDLPNGCRFAPRCPHAADLCVKQNPITQTVGEGPHTVSCFLADQKSGHPNVRESES